MELNQLEDAVKSDLSTLATLKMEVVSAKDFYVPVLILIFKVSLIFLAINAIACGVLHRFALYQPSISLGWVLGSWFCALGTSLMLGFSLSRMVLIGKLFKNRLKTGAFLKQKLLHFSVIFFLIYCVAYLLMTALVGLGMDKHALDTDVMAISMILAQFAAFIAAIVTTTFLFIIELDRLGLGVLWNVIGEWIQKSKRHHSESAQ